MLNNGEAEAPSADILSSDWGLHPCVCPPFLAVPCKSCYFSAWGESLNQSYLDVRELNFPPSGSEEE